MMGLQLRPAMAPAMDSSTYGMAGTSTGGKWEQLARELWPSEDATRDARSETIMSRIWDPLEAEAFDPRSLTLLEGLQILEWYEN
jgi:hypothetical protein